MENDTIASNAVISAEVADNSELDYNSITLKHGSSTVTRSDFKRQDSYADNKLRYEVSPELSAGSYTIEIQASDVKGNAGSWTGKVLVYTGEVSLVPGTSALATPSQFSPLRAAAGGTESQVSMVYNLTRPADIDLQIYSPVGRVVWARRFAGRAGGGLAGYNAVSWNGKDPAGETVGNGLYLYRIASGGRVIGNGYIIIYE